MFRIVIADDEKYIVQLIRALIDCERLGAQIVGEALDGAAALELVERLKPDILITDIRMPSMDGLELIDQIRARSLPVAVIAISGHRRFDYAISAIKYGVDDFIVKPINERDLGEALEKVCARLRGEQSASARERDLTERAEEHTWALRENLLRDMVAGTLPEGMTVDAINKRYGTRLREGGDYTAMAVLLDIPGALGGHAPIMERCERTVREALSLCCDEVECAAEDGALMVVTQTHGNLTRDLLGNVKKLFEQLAVALDAYNALSISIGLGPAVKAPSEVKYSAECARACARVKCVLGAMRIYQSAQLDIQHLRAEPDAAAVRALGTLIERHDVDQVEGWLKTVFSRGDHYYRENPVEAVALGDAVIKKFKGLCEGLGIDITGAAAQARFAAMGATQSLDAFMRAIVSAIVHVLTTDYEIRAEREAYPIVRAKAFMAEHLSEPIRLEDIAEAAALSPSYLSVLFKKESGETVSDHLMRIRLEEAKRLLRSTTLNLSEIAEHVGYADAKHFSKMFRKQTGARPNEYRKLYAW